MADFLCLLRGGEARLGELSDPDTQTYMRDWTVWLDSLSDDGHLVAGGPLVPVGVLIEGAAPTRRPAAIGDGAVGGYLLLRADTLDQAADLAQGCPIYQLEGSVEVRPVVEMQG